MKRNTITRILGLFLGAFLLISGTTAPKIISIQPYGTFPASEVEAAKAEITRVFKMDVILLPACPLPSSAWYAPRSRYRADKLLTHLYPRSPGAFKIIGLTTKDISTTNGKIYDWGVFGIGSLDGKCCVVSTFRLGKNDSLARIRMNKTIIHEIGHTLGLPHCPNLTCTMQDAEGSIKSMEREKGFCPSCKAKIKNYLK